MAFLLMLFQIGALNFFLAPFEKNCISKLVPHPDCPPFITRSLLGTQEGPLLHVLSKSCIQAQVFVVGGMHMHNTLPTSATGFSLFQGAFGYQPPLLTAQETEILVPLLPASACQYRQVWFEVSVQYSLLDNQRRSLVPRFEPGQRVWLSTKDLPLQLESQKLASKFVLKVILSLSPGLQTLRWCPSINHANSGSTLTFMSPSASQFRPVGWPLSPGLLRMPGYDYLMDPPTITD